MTLTIEGIAIRPSVFKVESFNSLGQHCFAYSLEIYRRESHVIAEHVSRAPHCVSAESFT